MSLFQTSVINKYLKGLDTPTVTAAWQKFTSHFHDPTIQANIRSSKEEQYQGGFLIDLFVNIFGYTKNPAPDFNLTTELKNVKGAKKTDGAILSRETALAVIELKGTNTTDLGKVEVQAFGYKNNQPGCVYVITSNFEKLRFYIDNAVDYEEFNLFQLTRERFDLLWLCLNNNGLLNNIPKQIKDESLTVEENITKELYKDYSLFRNEIFASIQKNNPTYDKLTLFKKTQKLLDRFLFIFFAEDRLLLPPNSIRSIIDQWTTLKDELDAYTPLYSRFKKYFGYMNTGHKGKQHDIFAYNGGLFAPDEMLDAIKIDDGLLYTHTQKLSNYDFESEVSVNILGHIFEHSLNEIEEIQAELAGIKTDKSKSKRKKDGVFYTPKYITKYIVDNTVGQLCEEQKTRLEIQEEEYEKDRKGRKKATLKALLKKLEDYRNWLLEITICDPACGSGAFLNQALEFLIAEHRYIDELQAKLLGDAFVLSEVENSILENNLFGVDINEESVEIAKLSLWLRTAQKGRKLTSLNSNIKCGNSLIDDPEVAGDKAFKWEEEFPRVFKNGGFDVVVGNPPYGGTILSEEDSFYRNRYEVSSYQLDTYPLFSELGYKINRKEGVLSFIIPSAWTSSVYDKEFRKFLLNKTNLDEVVIAEKKAFADATVETLILSFSKRRIDEAFKVTRWDKNNISYLLDLTQIDVSTDFKIPVYSNPNDLKIVRKLQSYKGRLNDYSEIVWGVKIYEKGKGTPPQISEDSKNKIFHSSEKTKDSHIPLIGGKDIQEYFLKWNGGYVDYGKWLAAPRNPDWFLTNKKRIVVREVTSKGKIQATIIDEPIVFSNSVDGVRMRPEKEEFIYTILAIINSKLLSFYHSNSSPNSFKDAFPKILLKDLREMPLPDLNHKSVELISKKASSLITQAKNLWESNKKFKRLIKRKFDLSTLPRKIENWDKLNFEDLIKEFKKKKISLSLKDEMQWEELFNEEKSKSNSMSNELAVNKAQIDQLVYQLYDLTPEEIAIIEESTT